MNSEASTNCSVTLRHATSTSDIASFSLTYSAESWMEFWTMMIYCTGTSTVWSNCTRLLAAQRTGMTITGMTWPSHVDFRTVAFLLGMRSLSVLGVYLGEKDRARCTLLLWRVWFSFCICSVQIAPPDLVTMEVTIRRAESPSDC